MNRKFIGIALALIAICLLAAGGTILISKAAINRLSMPPEIKVVNRSRENLENVKLEGSGFSQNLGTLHAGESRWVTVHPSGESGVYVSFAAGEREYISDYSSYFENSGGYRVIVTISKDFEIRTSYGSFLLP
jgi:hypothetical protein